jgi:alcohol dehydrogenase class IV
MLRYNADVSDGDVLDSRGSEYVRKVIDEIAFILGAKDIDNAAEMIRDLMRRIGLETKLSRLGINSGEDIETIIANGFNPKRVRNNPRTLTEEALRKILLSIY